MGFKDALHIPNLALEVTFSLYMMLHFTIDVSHLPTCLTYANGRCSLMARLVWPDCKSLKSYSKGTRSQAMHKREQQCFWFAPVQIASLCNAGASENFDWYEPSKSVITKFRNDSLLHLSTLSIVRAEWDAVQLFLIKFCRFRFITRFSTGDSNLVCAIFVLGPIPKTYSYQYFWTRKTTEDKMTFRLFDATLWSIAVWLSHMNVRLSIPLT